MARPAHLARRALGMLAPVGPRRDAQRWVDGILTERQLELWYRMKRADRRHAVGVARRAHRALGDAATTPVLAAALLHDVGKVDAGLGVYGRVVATLSGAAVGGDVETVKDWTRRTGFTRKVGLYLQHPRLGGDLLAMADSDPLTVAWAREHHLPEEDWTVPVEVGRALRDADDD